MAMMLQKNTNSASGFFNRRPAFSWRLVIKDCLYFMVLAILLGGLLNYSLLLNAFNGALIPRIQQNQLAILKSKAAQLYGISVIDIASSKKLFDDKLAIFVDARTLQEYEAGSISGAISLPARELLRKDIDPSALLPNKETVLVTYCDGGDCELALDVATDLAGKGYQNIFIFGEGYPGWAAAGYPVNK
jgi:rhodanese-related sulfurtransferase